MKIAQGDGRSGPTIFANHPRTPVRDFSLDETKRKQEKKKIRSEEGRHFCHSLVQPGKVRVH